MKPVFEEAAVTPGVTIEGQGLASQPMRVARGNDRGLMTEVIRDSDALDSLATEWRTFCERATCQVPFLTPEWMLTWWKRWGGVNQLFVVTVRNRGGRLVGLAPFCIRRSRLKRWGPRALRFLADQGVGTDHLDLIAEPDIAAEVVHEVVGSIQRHRAEWDYLELVDGAEDSPTFALLRKELRTCGLCEHMLRSSVCPFTPLPATFDEFLAGVSSNLRYNFRRRRRALEREPGFKFVVVEKQRDLEARFGEVARLHRLRFDDRRTRSSFLSAGIQDFHMETLPLFARHRTARLFFLEVQGKAIAGLYGFSVGNRFSFYQSGMDPAWSSKSVGLVLMGCVIEEAIRTGHREFDFLRGDEDYKFMWTSRSRRNVTVCFHDSRFVSRISWPYVSVREACRQLLKRTVLPALGLVVKN